MPEATPAPTTLYDKIFKDHLINVTEDGTGLLYIDRHIVHEVTSPQAFEGLKKAGRPVRRPDCTLTTVDHNIPTSSRKTYKNAKTFVEEPQSRTQVVTLEQNVKDFGLTYFGMDDSRQGIVHIIGPEQGFTLPGTTIVCGDSHTSTHGAFGALAFGIGTSEVEHVLATQTILQAKGKNMRIRVTGQVAEGVTAKDIILHIIGVIGTAGGTGHVIEYCGNVIESLSMEGRMSMCNMSIEAGARAGLIAPDDITFEYLANRPLAPKGAEWDAALAYWKTLKSDKDAHFDSTIDIDAKDIEPTVSWGTSPQDVVGITGLVPNPDDAKDEARKAAMTKSLNYMGLTPGTKMEDVTLDKVFIGSCTNARIEDLRSAARIAAGRKVADGVYAMIVPGSGLVKKQAEKEGLDKIFIEAGFDWREAGCSMCLGMNPDQLKPQERCASTSNRNFEGRQGPGGRTHLMSPAMATAAAINGRLTDVRKLGLGRGANIVPGNTGAPSITLDEGHAVPKPDHNKIVDEVSDSVGESAGAPKNDAPEEAAAIGLPKLTTIKAIAAPLRLSNVDTDQIIPARFLKTVLRSGLGPSCFYNLRYEPDGTEKPDFVLNKEPFRKANILVVTGDNFGCGSSREHAPWALLDFGIRVLIGKSFADIFFNNTFKNGMLPIVMKPEQVDALADDAEKGLQIEVDLPNQVVRRPSGEEYTFDVNEFRKQCLINGWDDISLTLKHAPAIENFEAKRTSTWPWLDGINYKGRKATTGSGPVEIPVQSTQNVKHPEW